MCRSPRMTDPAPLRSRLQKYWYATHKSCTICKTSMSKSPGDGPGRVQGWGPELLDCALQAEVVGTVQRLQPVEAGEEEAGGGFCSSRNGVDGTSDLQGGCDKLLLKLWLAPVASACVCICRPQSATSRKVRAHVSHGRRRRSTVQGLPEWGRGLPDNVSGHGMGQSGLRGIHLFPDFICSSLNEWRFLQGRL